MTEEELIDLGFQKVDILDEDSQNGFDYYFYEKELCDNLVLHSNDSIDIRDNFWYLECHDIPAIRIKSKDHFIQFLEIMDLITC